MLGSSLILTGAGIIILWGMAHVAPTSSVVKGFGPISKDSKRLITMTWVAEGLTLCFIGALVLFVVLLGGTGTLSSLIVYRACAAMLLITAVWTGFTGARTPVLPMKLCPVVKTIVAVLFLLGSVL